MSYLTTRFVGNLLATIFAVVVIGFGLAFATLIYKAFFLADTSIGLNTSFTGYAYISILATFVFIMLYGGYWVFRGAFRKPELEIELIN